MTEEGKKIVEELNRVKDGPAWLSYTHYRKLVASFEAVSVPDDEPMTPEYLALHEFLVDVAKLTDLPSTKRHTHFNAWALMRRGYKPEELTETEYKGLKALFEIAQPADEDDLELHEEGTHRAIYAYLTKAIGLDVVAGRGPVWHRARKLIEAYEGKEKQ